MHQDSQGDKHGAVHPSDERYRQGDDPVVTGYQGKARGRETDFDGCAVLPGIYCQQAACILPNGGPRLPVKSAGRHGRRFYKVSTGNVNLFKRIRQS